MDFASEKEHRIFVARQVAEDLIIEEAFTRYPMLRIWAEATAGVSTGGQVYRHHLAIVEPTNVRDEFARVIHDHQLRMRAGQILPPERVNSPSVNAVLVLVPSV